MDTLHPDMDSEVQRAARLARRVCVLAPHPNQALENLIQKHQASKLFMVTTPISSSKLFLLTEDKLVMFRIGEEAIKKLDSKPSESLTSLLARSTIYGGSYTSFDDIRKVLGLVSNQGAYFQKSFSAGGSGTRFVKHQEELDQLLDEPSWQEQASNGTIKAPQAGEIVGAEFAPIGYIAGFSKRAVFSSNYPGVTQFGSELSRCVIRSMYGD